MADSLHCERRLVTSLAKLVHEKTAGNPYFAVQFVHALVEEALFTFDYGERRWSWDLQRINAKGYTDNVADLMLRKLNRLPFETQKALQELACLGNSAEIATLSIVHGASEEELHLDLWEAVRLELVVRLERFYKFVHDRVQEAAYSLIPDQSRAAIHLRIGRLLWTHIAPGKREEVVFEIVNQLNRGADLISLPDEREQLAELNLIAGKRAKISTAYVSALGYLVSGCALLAEDSWEQRYPLTFALEFQRAECEFLTGNFPAAEERLSMLSGRVRDLVEIFCSSQVFSRIAVNLASGPQRRDYLLIGPWCFILATPRIVVNSRRIRDFPKRCDLLGAGISNLRPSWKSHIAWRWHESS
jgi:predicted ATPase